MKPSQILRRAAGMTAEDTWTQGFYARDKEGRDTAVTSEQATCFCTYGLMAKAAGLDCDPQTLSPKDTHESLEAALFVSREIECSIVNWNDEPERTWQEVKNTLAKAAEAAEKAGR